MAPSLDSGYRRRGHPWNTHRPRATRRRTFSRCPLPPRRKADENGTVGDGLVPSVFRKPPRPARATARPDGPLASPLRVGTEQLRSWLLAAVCYAPRRTSEPVAAAEQPDTVLQLLEFIRVEAEEGSRLNRARVERFREARNERQRMLEAVTRELEAEHRRSADFNRRYEQNETDLAQLAERLRVRIGNFGELFGVVRDVAGDTVGEVLNSLVTAQYPGPCRRGPGEWRSRKSCRAWRICVICS